MILKTMLVVAAATLSLTAEAKPKKAAPVRNVIYSEASSHRSHFSDKGACKGYGEKILNHIYTNVITPAYRANLEYQCQKVFIDIKTVVDRDFYIFEGGVELFVTYFATISCEPRSLRDKQILSLIRTCETAPTQECYSDAFLDKIGQLPPTSYTSTHTGPCK